MNTMIYFTLYSRSYCHLCDDMRIALQALVKNIPHQIDLVDVDQDVELVKLYDELVPVLFARNADDANNSNPGLQLCHYFLDVEKVKAFCHA